MKIIQLNIWGGRLEKQILDLLNRENADIVCLQEAVEIDRGKGSFLVKNLKEIQKDAGYEYSSFFPQFGFNLMNRQAKMGLAVLSNYPFKKTEAIFTRLEYVDDFDFLDTDYNIRGFQHVVIEKEGQPLNVINHHGHHLPDHKNGDEETMRQCKMIVDYIEKLEGSVVLCGDFNLLPDSESIDQINKILVNHVKERDILTTRTPLTRKTEVCDYIFTSPDIEIKDFQVLDDIASDHKALSLTF